MDGEQETSLKMGSWLFLYLRTRHKGWMRGEKTTQVIFFKFMNKTPKSFKKKLKKIQTFNFFYKKNK